VDALTPHRLDQVAPHLAEIGRRFYARGWVFGTSGNFSAVLSRQPLRLAMTPSSVDKGGIAAEQILEIGPGVEPIGNPGAGPSAESLLHVEIALRRGAGAVLHTHSVWSTILSDLHAAEGGFAIQGYEMLKGLAGVQSHEHREWLPILENSQDMNGLARRAGEVLERHPEAHGFLLRRHGLYTWGSDLAEAERHVEILEFLLEAVGRTRLITRGA
jgi:methylthioribulose-1-phosphate dehydratase